MDSFSRAGDPDSLYNLGNTYVQLGFWALALEAYQSTLLLAPTHEDALHNLSVVQRILKSGDDEQNQASLAPKQKPVDQTDTPQESKDGGATQEEPSNEGGEQEAAQGERESTKTSTQTATEAQAASARNEGEQHAPTSPDKDPGGGDVTGRQDESAPRDDAGGGAENLARADSGAGARAPFERKRTGYRTVA